MTDLVRLADIERFHPLPWRTASILSEDADSLGEPICTHLLDANGEFICELFLTTPDELQDLPEAEVVATEQAIAELWAQAPALLTALRRATYRLQYLAHTPMHKQQKYNREQRVNHEIVADLKATMQPLRHINVPLPNSQNESEPHG